MTYAWYSNYWWVPEGDVDCTVENMEQVLERSPTILSDPGILNSSEIVDAGIVSILIWFNTLSFKQADLYCSLLFASSCLRISLDL